jgi:hypothetical protein
MGRARKYLDNPFDLNTDRSLYNSYNYYTKNYPERSREDILNRVISTRINDAAPFFINDTAQHNISIYTPPIGNVIHEDINYIYYDDCIWSKATSKKINPRVYPRQKCLKCLIFTPDKSAKITYTIGTIPLVI